MLIYYDAIDGVQTQAQAGHVAGSPVPLPLPPGPPVRLDLGRAC